MELNPLAVPDNGDEVARQRRKRATHLLDRPVAGFDDLTLRGVVRSVVAANEECPDPLDVEQFLTARGHVWQTVEAVLVCLGSVDDYASSGPTTPRR